MTDTLDEVLATCEELTGLSVTVEKCDCVPQCGTYKVHTEPFSLVYSGVRADHGSSIDAAYAMLRAIVTKAFEPCDKILLHDDELMQLVPYVKAKMVARALGAKE